MLFGTENVEFEILQAIHSFSKSAVLDFLVPKVSWLGNGGFIWIVLCVVLLITKKHRRCGIALSLGLVLCLIFGNIILKNLIARPRPCWIFDVPDMLIPIPTDFSFPSGHTYSSFLSAFVLLEYNKKWGFVALFVAAIMAFTRLYLFVHFPTDILGGVLLAAVIFLLVRKILKK
ncbi:MAG: phosphatase PAP2 family protein [Clostridia bacterium]|nr:phosphatase PAP2 family protein [Clostridia bacterium]